MRKVPDPADVERVAAAIFEQCMLSYREIHRNDPNFPPGEFADEKWTGTSETNREHWRTIAETALYISLEDA